MPFLSPFSLLLPSRLWRVAAPGSKMPRLPRPSFHMSLLALVFACLPNGSHAADRSVGWRSGLAWCLPADRCPGTGAFLSAKAQPNLLGPLGRPFPPHPVLGVRSQERPLGCGSPAPHFAACSLALGSGLGVSYYLCSGCQGRGLLDSGDTVSNLCLHFASFSLLCLSPCPSECTAFHSVVLGDTYNIPLDPRGKQRGSAALWYPGVAPRRTEAPGQTQDLLGSGCQRGHGCLRSAPNGLSSPQGRFLSLSSLRWHPAWPLPLGLFLFRGGLMEGVVGSGGEGAEAVGSQQMG